MTGLDAIQRRWARVVGFSYVFALAPAVFAEFYVSGRLVFGNAIVTAQNIIAHKRLFRLGLDWHLCFPLRRFPRAHEGDHGRVLRRSDLLLRALHWFVAALQGRPARRAHELDMNGA